MPFPRSLHTLESIRKSRATARFYPHRYESIPSKITMTGQSQRLLTDNQRHQIQQYLSADSLSAEQRHRLQIMLLSDEGWPQKRIVAHLGCAPQTVRYWRLMAETGQLHRWQERSLGRPKQISPEYIDRLKKVANESPRSYNYPYRQWTARRLSDHLAREFDITVSERHLNRLLKELNLDKKSRQNDRVFARSSQGTLLVKDL
jgi:transposase